MTIKAVLALGLSTCVAVPVFAQSQQPSPPTPSRGTPVWIVSANAGFQISAHDYEHVATFDIFEEAGTLRSSGKLKSGPVIDGGVIYRLTDQYGVGAAFSWHRSTSDVDVLATIPHPVLFDQPRTVASSASGVEHTSSALHLQGVWFVPFTTQIDFSISAGPSIVFVSQELVTAATLRPEEPPFTSPAIDSLTIASEGETAVGFNVGADARYALTPRYSVGLTARYVWSSADFDGLTESLKPGGLQFLGGIRLKF